MRASLSIFLKKRSSIIYPSGVKIYFRLFLLCTLFFHLTTSKAQSVSFALKTSPSNSFVFDTFDKYKYGITQANFLNLKVEAVGTEWDLYIGSSTITSGYFDINTLYSTSGSSALPISILQARVHNTSNTTSTGTSFFNLTDISTPTYLIGSAADDATITCGTAGTNVAGSYTTQPQCYNFKVDIKASPGLTYRPGSYSLRIDFYIVQDL